MNHVQSLFVDVAVDLQTSERRRLLTYAVPAHLSDRIAERQLVLVPVRRERKLAVVVRVHCDEPDFEVRAIHAIAEPDFTLSDGQWELIEWLSEETICTLYDAASPFFPPGINNRHVVHLVLADGLDPDSLTLTPLQDELVQFLQQRGEVSVTAVRRAFKRSLRSVVSDLERKGIIERVARVRPGNGRGRKTRFVQRTCETAPDFGRAVKQKRALEVIERRLRLSGDQPVPLDDITQRVGVTDASVKKLVERGLVEYVDVPLPVMYRSEESRSTPGFIQLSKAQGSVWQDLATALRAREHVEFLLHGVTASGKTELYLRAAAWCIHRGRQVIVLVPEIALATQLVERFASRFPGQVALLHSGLPDGERYNIWRAARDGTIPIIVGARSALFTPFPNIGLIVLDEEHETSFKQESTPRYHARDVAHVLTRHHKAVLLLGSATPDVVTWHHSQNGTYRYLSLPERIGIRVADGERGERAALEMPLTQVVDMRLELQHGNMSALSRALQDRVSQSIEAGEQSILFLNRRGMSTVIQCRSCGHVLDCPYCDVPLVFHADRRRALCHRCGHQVTPSPKCAECGSSAVSYYGTGTQRIEREARALFPDARVLRWDQDAVRGGVTHRDLYQRVLKREIDVVVGTQMVAKGFDFPGVSTIGVINSDTQLHLPDFRATERTFQLITQVAGRAGRRMSGSLVVVQSYSPNHYAIQTALRHDYAAFVREELAYRQEFRYPPYSRLVRLLYRNANEVQCEGAAIEMSETIARTAFELGMTDLEILGPTPAFVAKIRNVYQWQLVLRGADGPRVMRLINPDPGWSVDVDPMSVL